MRHRFAFALALLLPFAAQAAAPSFQKAFELYLVGANEQAPDHEDANEQANEAFAKLLESDPSNPLYMTYLGSTWMLKARDAWFPWNKMKHAERGLALMDKALSLLGPAHGEALPGQMSVSAQVRSIAAIGFVRLPDARFKRLRQGNDMLRALIESAEVRNLPGPATAHLHYFAGEAARLSGRPGEAETRYREAVELAPGSTYAALAERALGDMKK